jgi:hypothetical protein
MAIRRVTFEMDDTIDKNPRTSVPSSLVSGKEIMKKREENMTQSPDTEDIDTESTLKGGIPKIHGRTWSDLIHESKNTPRDMATLFIIIPFVIFVSKIDSIESFKYPIALGIVLNIIWFGVSYFTKKNK